MKEEKSLKEQSEVASSWFKIAKGRNIKKK
jgi:hypothetical protein